MPRRETRLPDFILIGAQKSGTTALIKNLRMHPGVHIGAASVDGTEMHFFNNEKNWSRGVAWYQDHFDRPHLLQGEKTPNYLATPVAIERIAATVPDARLIVLLRDPVARAYSQWNHFNQQATRFASLGWEVLGFEEAIERSRNRPRSIFGGLLAYGMYERQLAKVLEHFDREQLFIGIAERWRASPAEPYERLLEFLGLESWAGDYDDDHVRKYPQPMNPATAASLARYFAESNQRLFDLIGEEVPEWDRCVRQSVEVGGEIGASFGSGYDVCFVTTCMGRLEHLQQSLPRMVAQRNACALVVDYSCPQRAGDWVEREFDSSLVHVVRVEGKTNYSAAKARNAGALVPVSRWVVMVDADTLLPERFLDAQLPEFCDGRYYVLVEEPRRWSDMPEAFMELYGLVIARPADLRRIGGYDDVMEGWGGEDLDLRARLRDAGLQELRLMGKLPEAIAHQDDDRMQHHRLADKHLSNALNLFYHRVKRDMAKLSEAQLDLAERERLYRALNAAFKQAAASGKSLRFEVPLPARSVEKGTSLTLTLVYRLQVAPGTFEVTEVSAGPAKEPRRE